LEPEKQPDVLPLRRVKTALPGRKRQDGRDWTVLLDCNHTILLEAAPERPRKGDKVWCYICESRSNEKP